MTILGFRNKETFCFTDDRLKPKLREWLPRSAKQLASGHDYNPALWAATQLNFGPNHFASYHLASQLDAIYVWVEQEDVLIKSDLVLNYKLQIKSLCVDTKFSDCVGQDAHCGIHSQLYMGEYTSVFALPPTHEYPAQHTLVNLIYL